MKRTPDKFWKTASAPGILSTVCFVRATLLENATSCPEMITYHADWNGGNYELTKPEWEELMRLRDRTPRADRSL